MIRDSCFVIDIVPQTSLPQCFVRHPARFRNPAKRYTWHRYRTSDSGIALGRELIGSDLRSCIPTDAECWILVPHNAESVINA